MTQKLFYSRTTILFLLLPLVWHAHSSYSLSENHKLHKRMSSTTIPLEIKTTDRAEDLFGESFGHSNAFSNPASPPELEIPSSPRPQEHKISFVHDQGNPSGSTAQSNQHQPHQQPPSIVKDEKKSYWVARKIFWPIGRKVTRLTRAARWKTRQFRQFFNKLTPKKTGRNVLDQPFFEAPKLSQIQSEDDLLNVDDSIDKFLKKRVTPPSDKTDPVHLRKELKTILQDVVKLNKEVSSKEPTLKGASTRIENRISDILNPSKAPKEPSEALLKLGKQLSEYQREVFHTDKLIITDRLNKQSKGVPNILGLLGPGNALEDQFRSLLIQHFSDQGIANQVMAKIKELHQQQTKLAAAVLSHEFSSLEPELPINKVGPIHTSMNVLSQEIFAFFDKNEQFRQLVINHFKSPVTRAFYHELSAPKTLSAAELQLLEPWGIGRILLEIPFDKMPTKRLNTIRPRHEEWRILAWQSPLALQNTKIRLHLASQAHQIVQKLSQHIRPDEIDNLVKAVTTKTQTSRE